MARSTLIRETDSAPTNDDGRDASRTVESQEERVWGRPRTLLGHLRRLREYGELWRSLTLKEIRVRYKQSLLGVGWAVLQPVAMMVVFTLVFSRFLHVQSEGAPYPIFSYVALVPWTFFSSSLSSAVPSIVSNMSLVTKVYFPREIFPLAAIGACLVDFSIAAVIVVGLAFWYGVGGTWTLLCVPMLIALQIMVVVGVSLIASAVNVFFRDIRFIVPLVLQVWMYASPVAYPLDKVPARLRPYYMLNPMAGIIDGYRRLVLHGTLPGLLPLAVTAAGAFVLLVVGYLFFKRVEMKFADII